MKTILKSLTAAMLLAASVSSAQAAVIQLGSFSKSYGTSGSAASSDGAGTCDVRSSTSINVREASSCQRFYDTFDFSSLSYQSLDHLKLTLTFGNTNNTFENWNVRFAQSPTVAVGPSKLIPMTKTGNAQATQEFIFDAALGGTVFDTVATNEKLVLWFAEQGLGAHNFNLYSAKLDVYGTAVPEPTSIALFGLALGALGVARRRKR
ncbi:MAG: PEP-CTERM sorting domain-containing protein [Lysobacteraceae bacterium]|nr:MAG: PEP-CTERM sorting domain-containing protein [Xanthomonadaceae bacterium]